MKKYVKAKLMNIKNVASIILAVVFTLASMFWIYINRYALIRSSTNIYGETTYSFHFSIIDLSFFGIFFIILLISTILLWRSVFKQFKRNRQKKALAASLRSQPYNTTTD
jgi:lysylphosphatidylglycerol synthetase-like protein (DUF2156 family)